MQSRSIAIAGLAAAAAALGVATWHWLDERAPALELGGGYLLAAPRALPAVELVDERGAAFGAAHFAGHWSFLYFGYTYCPDICPLTLVKLAALKQQLAEDGLAARTELYLVSVDPERDTPARLREYVAYFDPELRGLTGLPEDLAALAQATETVFEVPDSDDDDYLVSHSSNVVLLDPSGRAHAVFAPPHDAVTLAADFAKIVARYDGAR